VKLRLTLCLGVGLRLVKGQVADQLEGKMGMWSGSARRHSFARRRPLPVAAGSAVLVACLTTGGLAGAAGSGTSHKVSTWNFKAANQKLLSIVGTYPTATGSTTRGITGKTVSFGCVAPDTTSGTPTIYQGFCEGVKARLAQADKTSSFPYKVVLKTSADSGDNQTTSVIDLTKAVDTNHDFGVFVISGLGAIGSNILEQTHVPYFGSFSTCGKQSVFGFDVSYGIENCTALLTTSNKQWYTYGDGVMKAFTTGLHMKYTQVHYAGLGYDTGVILSYVTALEAQYKAVGAHVVANSTSLPVTSSTISDLSPYVAPIVSANPNLVGIFSSDPHLISRLMGALKSSGYKKYVTAACTANLVKTPAVANAVTGCLATSIGWGFPGFGGPGWAVLTKEAKQMGQTTPVTLGFLHGWFSADLAVDGMADFAKTSKPLTTESLVNYLNDGWTYPGYDDVTAPQTFPYGKYSTSPCASMAKLSAAKKAEVPFQDLICGTARFQQIGGK